jgi:hypothetical protein
MLIKDLFAIDARRIAGFLMVQALALAQRQAPPAQPPPLEQPKQEVQVVERVVATVDPVTQYKLERMEAQAKELAEEREVMHRLATDTVVLWLWPVSHSCRTENTGAARPQSQAMTCTLSCR